MENPSATWIVVETWVLAPVDHVWICWTDPGHVTGWNFASEDWHCPAAHNDLKLGGVFSYTMAAKDGSFSFDFEGEFDVLEPNKLIGYLLGDGRLVRIEFLEHEGGTKVVEQFQAETMNPVDLQRDGWQAILNQFKRYAESKGSIQG
jgi:uncharacterized protein YndB with AHSA1/START domain